MNFRVSIALGSLLIGLLSHTSSGEPLNEEAKTAYRPDLLSQYRTTPKSPPAISTTRLDISDLQDEALAAINRLVTGWLYQDFNVISELLDPVLLSSRDRILEDFVNPGPPTDREITILWIYEDHLNRLHVLTVRKSPEVSGYRTSIGTVVFTPSAAGKYFITGM